MHHRECLQDAGRLVGFAMEWPRQSCERNDERAVNDRGQSGIRPHHVFNFAANLLRSFATFGETTAWQ